MYKMAKYCVSVIAFASVFGCATQSPLPKYEIKSKFDQEQSDSLTKEGSNTVKGSALMRQVGGGIVTCAGQTISLVPVTDYSKERITYLYGTENGGYLSASNMQRNPQPFSFTDPAYEQSRKHTTCDAQGFFKFEKLADGEFYIGGSITWKSNPNNYFFDGGTLMRRVKVQGGETKDIVIAP